MLVALVLVVLLDLFTVAVRSALLTANLVRLLAAREEQGAKVERVLDLLNTPRNLQAGLNLAQLLTRFLAAGLVLALFNTQDWTPSAILLADGMLLLAVLVIFWLELAIDVLIARQAEIWAIRLAPGARLLMAVLSPFLVLPLAINARRGTPELSSTVTEAELKSMVDAGHQGGVLEQDERQMIYSIFELGDTLVREIMVPRIYINAVDVATPLSEAVDLMVRSGQSRVPVYEETIDSILGLLYAKDLLRVWRDGSQDVSLRSLLRPAYFVPEAKKVDELFAEMQARRVHMAVVVDEYGGVAGLLTMEDIVEEIFGDIRDEYDQSEELPYQKVGNGEFVFQGRIALDDFNELLGSCLSAEEADTLGGVIYSRVGRVPATGEQVRIDNLLLTVEQVSGRRIRKVRARCLQPEEMEQPDAQANAGEPGEADKPGTLNAASVEPTR